MMILLPRYSLGTMAGIRLALLLNTLHLITCQNTVLQYSITEEQASLQFSADIATDSGIKSDISPEASANLKYKIASAPMTHQGTSLPSGPWFQVDERVGILRTNGRLDRDAICPGLLLCAVSLDISALSPPDFFRIVKVNITIEDINDSSPRFSSNSSSITIPETSPVGFRFTIPRATDKDSPQYGIQGYRMIDNLRELKLDSLDDQQNIQPYIQLEQRLDREIRSNYDIEIEVFDSTLEQEANIAKLFLHIDVLDANDNAPYFEPSTYERVISEDFNVSSVITQVHALDHDYGDNAALLYHFEPSTQLRYGAQFSLNELSGEVTLTKALDYETQQSIELIITATEKNPNNIPATATVLLTIEDVNDNIPVISVESIAGTSTNIELAENTGPGAFLAHLSVLDRDSGQGGDVTCLLREEQDALGVFKLEQIVEQNYKLSTNINLDHELRRDYSLQVVCADNGIPPHSVTYAATVTVLDENDHTPVLQQEHFTVALEENNAVGVQLVHLNATDRDSGRNAEVVYQVLSGPRNYINVDPYSGSVTARMSFDYEQVQLLSYLIIAFDQGVEKRTATATVQINITDQNDRAPNFVLPHYRMHIEENKIPGSFVGSVEAIDDDSILFNQFLFEFDPSMADAFHHFAIDPYSGDITTKQVLDREQMGRYSLAVRAFDKLKPTLYSVVNVTIIVDDSNDHAPAILFPNANNNTVDFNPESGKHSVTRINATDADSENNALLTYQILTGDREEVFYLDETSGILFVQDIDKLVLKTKYSLNILVKDNGASPLSNETWLHVNIVEESKFLPSNAVILTIIGIVSGVIIIVLIIAIVLLKRRYWKASAKHHKGEQTRPDLHYTLQSSNPTPSPPLTSKHGDYVPGVTVTPWPPETSDVISQGSADSVDHQIHYHSNKLAKGQPFQEVVYGYDADNCSLNSTGDSGRGSTQVYPQNQHNGQGNVEDKPDLLETTWRDPLDRRNYHGMSSFRSSKPTTDNQTARVAPRLNYTSASPKSSPRVHNAPVRSSPVTTIQGHTQEPYELNNLSNTNPYNTFGKPLGTKNIVDIDKNKMNSYKTDNRYPNRGHELLESGC